jgi:hypothetical protein
MTTNLRPLTGPLRAAVIIGLVVLAALTVPACGSSESETPSPTELFQEYIESTDVKNDPFGNGGSPEDRKANLAAHGSPQQILNGLLAEVPCDTVEEEECPSAGSGTNQRHVLVKHEDGSLELMPLYVTRRSGKAAVLTDSKGETYTGGLEDFRQHNDLLSTDDLILTPRAITSTSGSRLAVVSGHTDTSRPWLIGGAAAVVAVVAGGLATRYVILRRSRDAT